MSPNPCQITGINHIGIAPKDLATAKKFFEDILGIPFLGSEEVLSQKTGTHFFDSKTMVESSESPRIEFLESLAEDSPIQKFLDKKGSGLHHIALTVVNIDETLAYLKRKGVQLINEDAKPGAHNTRVAFIHPKATGGFLLELVEPQ